ncbi:hypothetical protein KBZ18_11430 [Synechococcus sp. Cruz-9H2]|uniref:hypothetical protein n=1 Tax=unclassified Synechococcus TaxID=2626047 RepID=UPI0020CDD3F5|nr:MULTISPECIES: hypothetical protein [unclassified Synechococcus]MCP9820098.1 hypothetical protein [Synechococcus sp. Cruz-9H2]MCP9844475.1 hypothetical protein [Synechococcus sp. Edmonson 11F2]MCP9856528.1 hypothetical protein [Synechococcus sp. Cruz-9C9]MCP9863813.1 hypothetical protein [Synechococcus sp. Cruz-7E5]MCP9871079.1 hypothetical protein [Synechococcus sp. Cruz-7B9]
MDANNSVPQAISHRQLITLLQTATPDTPMVESGAEADRSDELEGLLRSYGQVSQRLLQALQQKNGALAKGRNPRQLMAIGALQAHVTMALQALTASQA